MRRLASNPDAHPTAIAAWLHRAALGCRGTPAPYKQSLLPTLQGDIAPLGEIPRYRIAVSLDVDALILTGRQQVRYTNNEDSKVGNYQRMCSG
jgi:hypothetical protein